MSFKRPLELDRLPPLPGPSGPTLLGVAVSQPSPAPSSARPSTSDLEISPDDNPEQPIVGEELQRSDNKGKARARDVERQPEQVAVGIDEQPPLDLAAEDSDDDEGREIEDLEREEDLKDQADPAVALTGWRAKRMAKVTTDLATLKVLEREAHDNVAQIHRAIVDSAALPPLDRVLATSAASSAATRSKPLDREDPLALLLATEPDLIEFLAALADSPCAIDLDAWAEQGVLALVLDIDIDERGTLLDTAQYYIRRLNFTSPEKLIDACKVFAQRYPANSTLAAAIAAEVRFRPASCSLAYGGVTVANVPAGRVLDDGKKAEGSLVKRFIPFALSLPEPPSYETFEIVRLRTPATMTDFLFSRDVASREILLISLMTFRSLNRALGGPGRVSSIQFDPRLVKLVQGAVPSQADMDGILARAPESPAHLAKLASLRTHFASMLAFLEDADMRDVGTIADLRKPAGRFAFDESIRDGTALHPRLDLNGAEVELAVLIPKDVTRSCLTGKTTFTGPKAAPAPRLYWLVEAMLADIDPDENPDGLRQLMARSDFWVFCTRHLLVIVHLFYLFRYLNIISPIVVISRSSKVFNILQSGVLGRLVPLAASYILDDFLDANSPTSAQSLVKLLSLTILDIKWKETAPPNWIDSIGKPVVVVRGPGPLELSLVVPLVDEGLLNHDPALANELEPLVLLSHAVAGVAQRVVAVKLATTGRPSGSRADAETWYRAACTETEAAVAESGLGDELERVRKRAHSVWSALSGARGRSRVEDTRLAKESALGLSREEVIAIEGEQMSRQRLASDGPRFDGPPIAPSDPFFASAFDAAGRLDFTLVRAPDPRPRVSQYLELLDLHLTAILNRALPILPPIADHAADSREYALQFLAGPSGAEYRRSTAQIGKPHTRPIGTPEEEQARIEGYRDRQRKIQERRRRARGILNSGEAPLNETLASLAGEEFATGVKNNGILTRRQITMFECGACDGVWLGSLDKFLHRCEAADPTRPPSVPVRHRVLYPHFFFDRLSSSGKLSPDALAELVLAAGLRPTTARAHLSAEVIALLPVALASLDPTIYVSDATSVELAAAMAIDALILVGTAPPLPQLGPSDDWFWNEGVHGHEALIKRLCEGVQGLGHVYYCGAESATGDKCTVVLQRGDPDSTAASTKRKRLHTHKCRSEPILDAENQPTGQLRQLSLYEYERDVTNVWEFERDALRRYAFAFYLADDPLRRSCKDNTIEDLLRWSFVPPPPPAPSRGRARGRVRGARGRGGRGRGTA